MTPKELRELLDLLIERGIHEFEMERGNLKISVKRDPGTRLPASEAPSEPVVVASSDDKSFSAPQNTPSQTASAKESKETSKEMFIVKSPMVGTYYQAPNPDTPAFVNAGDVVEIGQVLCIIEAMKLMNEIEAEVPGEVVRTYVENGQPVEYGQSLFAIHPSRKK